MTHPIQAKERLEGVEYCKPVVICNNGLDWGKSGYQSLGYIGDNAVIASGSVVVKDVESDTVVGGNPAKITRRLRMQI